MKSFKTIAEKILRDSGKTMHYRDITKVALSKGLIKTEGKTPWATMNAVLSINIKQKGDRSEFIRTEPGYFALKSLKIKTMDKIRTYDNKVGAIIVRHQINPALNSKQKGDIAESRVAELITLYCKEPLVCYRPISDIEGIDIIVKRRDDLKSLYIQVKSTFAFKERGFVTKINENKIISKKNMILVFVYFDLSEGDLYDQVFCIPAPSFLKLTQNKSKKNPKDRVFSAGLKRPDKSKYAEFMIEKRELANRILEIMEKL